MASTAVKEVSAEENIGKMTELVFFSKYSILVALARERRISHQLLCK